MGTLVAIMQRHTPRHRAGRASEATGPSARVTAARRTLGGTPRALVAMSVAGLVVALIAVLAGADALIGGGARSALGVPLAWEDAAAGPAGAAAPATAAARRPAASPDPGAASPGSAPPTPQEVRTPQRPTSPREPAAVRPVARTSWGPTVATVSRARRLVARMSLAEKAGQVIVARFDGTRAPLSLMREHHLGGVIVMEDNVASPAQLRRLSAALTAQSNRLGRPYPPVLAVDQEGGLVAGVGKSATQFPTLMSLGAARDHELAERVARASGSELRAMGFTMVFAPVADVTSGPSDPTIGSRSISSRPRVVARMVSGLLRGYRQAGVVPVVKHFPGHGSVPTDSHETLPAQDASLPELERRDFIPFRRAVAGGAPAVMVAHLDLRRVDPGVPSSLSARVVRGVLRERLGFSGLAVTDALEMGAVTQRYDSAEAAVRALLAGEDMLLMPTDVGAAHAGILAAVRSGRLSTERLDAAATRVVATMLHQAASAGPQPALRAVGRHRAVSLAVSAQAATVVSGSCTGRLVGESVDVVGGDPTDRARFIAAAQRAGLATGSGDTVVLLGYSTTPGSGDVVVSLDAPYGLGASSATSARIALYGRTPEAFRALVDVLTGGTTAPGQLPVAVTGVARPGCR